ncbi:gp58-like family protein [Limosilactobacillus reuteri]|uniref:gp58-like family protein n=1 Tax=Limosilactobacillus reuteri TaxID=1598 RepID=UPI002AAC2B35|nr:gp58-like family protein [Limosilactobacillus reuteri]WPU43966.1 gp58-like family protein [Limosilactobacillus reuteri]
MAENSQLSDETKNNSTDTSSTDASSAVIGNHENAVVPHKISNHDKLVQTMVMVDGEWINVNDTNDQANMKEDMHKVNKKVVEAQKGIVEAKNAADSAVKYADSAVSASKANSDAIVAQSSAISEAKAATDSATAEVQQLKANAASDAASIRADVAAASKTLTGQGKQIATINTTLDGLNTKYEGFSDNLSKLSGTVATNSTQIDQNKNSIALKADQAAVNSLSGKVNQNTAQLKVQADQISSKVSSEDFNALSNKAMQNRGTVKAPDFNTLTQAGYYTVINTGSGKNYPVTNWGTLEVSGQAADSNGRLNQKYVTDNNGGTYVRQYNTNLKTWTAWVKSANQNDIETLNGKISKNSTAIDQNSKSIALKADQTVVDTIKNTATQNSSRLDTMANEIQSKVTSTDVNNIINGKGYTTSDTVQSLITQESVKINENITNLTNTVNGNNGGGVNLVSGTIEDIVVDDTANTGTQGWRFDVFPLNTELKVGDKVTVSADVVLTGKGDLSKWGMSLWSKDVADIRSNQYSADVGKGSTVTLTVTSISDISKPTALLIYCGQIGDTEGKKAVFHHLKVERGTVATPWTPAPSDNASVTQLQSVTASIDGLQSTVTNYQNDTSTKFTQLSDSIQSKVSQGDFNSKVTQLANDINLRVTKGDLISQINLEAGGDGLISIQNGKGKLMLDADSVVFGNKAFIPSAYITNINADKITTGTLDVSKLNVKNFSADNISGGTLSGVVVKTGANDRYFQTSKDNIYWVRNGSMSLVGNDTYLNSANGLNIADKKNIQLTTWGGATVNKDGSITNNSGNSGHPKIVIDDEGKYNPDDIYGSAFAGGPGDSEIVQWVGNKEYTALTRGKGFIVHLNDGNNKSIFSIQKDNEVGFYVGQGENGNQVNVYGAKNSAVKTSQGDVAVSAYETAEYYFGDIGEGQTGSNGVAYVGIEKLFNETVNTNIPYQVFLTAYGPGNLWVCQREHDRFVVKSDQPNIKFGWEIKAKRRGYENTRLQKIN